MERYELKTLQGFYTFDSLQEVIDHFREYEGDLPVLNDRESPVVDIALDFVEWDLSDETLVEWFHGQFLNPIDP